MSLLDRLNVFVWSFRHKFSTLPEYEFNDNGEVVCEFTPIKWTKQAIVSLVTSAVVGALLGIFIAFILNGTFVELALSPRFSTYLGIVLVLLSLVIAKRTLAIDKLTQIHLAESPRAKIPRCHVLTFAMLNLLTGVTCFLFEFEKIMLYQSQIRILFLTFVGMSLSFGLTYAIVDGLNLFIGWFRPGGARPLVEFLLQIYVVVFASLCMGASFGCLFGIFDYENHWLNMIVNPSDYEQKEPIHLAYLVDIGITVFTGLFWGALAGLANEYIQRVEMAFDRLDQPIEFETDI